MGVWSSGVGVGTGRPASGQVLLGAEDRRVSVTVACNFLGHPFFQNGHSIARIKLKVLRSISNVIMRSVQTHRKAPLVAGSWGRVGKEHRRFGQTCAIQSCWGNWECSHAVIPERTVKLRYAVSR